MNIVDLAQARAYAELTEDLISAGLINKLANEVESLERAMEQMRAKRNRIYEAYCAMRIRARYIAANNPHPEAGGAALRILGGRRAFLAAPVVPRQGRAVKLRADAAYWTGVAAEEIDGEKQAMAEEMARLLGELAKEADL